jgi:predicted DNA-binding transcriptional regulator YafY
VKLKDGRKTYYRYEDRNYSIKNEGINEAEANQLKEAIITLGRFKGMPQFEWVEELTTRLAYSFKLIPNNNKVIEFEQNPYLKGLEFISEIYHAIVYNKVLKISYQGFKQTKVEIYEIHPYFLKQYNNRWFLFARNYQYENLSNLSLDRIVTIEVIGKKYIETDIDFSDYFEDIIGVSSDLTLNPIEITIKADKTLWPYIKTKPIHGSQKVKELDEDYTIFSLNLIPNYELESKLLHFGEQLEVLSPESVRKTLADRIQEMNKKYNCAD